MNKIISMHNHIFPEKIAVKATISIGEFYGLQMTSSEGTSENLLAESKPYGVVKYLVCSTATKPEQVQSINNFLYEETVKHPQFFGFASLHPLMENIEEEIDRIISLGFRGIKLHPDMQKFNLDDPLAFPLYEAINNRLPVLIHMGDSRYDYSKPYRLANVIDNFPNLTFIAAHLGGYTAWDEALNEYIGNPSVYLDTSSSLTFLPPEKAAKIIRTHGINRVFFGTDFPMWQHKNELELLYKLGLNEDELYKILYGNAEKFLSSY